MANFGLSDLRLVNPDEFDGYRLEGIAHRTSDIIEASTMHPTLDAAIGDASLVVGTTARARTAGRPYVRPREVAESIAAHVAPSTSDGPEGSVDGGAGGGTVAILFGREDRGLMNDALDRCHAVAIIPTSVEYSSLNLAQAALVMAYEAFLAIEGGGEEMPRGRRATRPPTNEELEEAFAALADGLGRIEFYKARKPEAVMRTLRTIILRAEPDLRETRLLGAVGYEIGNYLDRTFRADE